MKPLDLLVRLPVRGPLLADLAMLAAQETHRGVTDGRASAGSAMVIEGPAIEDQVIEDQVIGGQVIGGRPRVGQEREEGALVRTIFAMG